MSNKALFADIHCHPNFKPYGHKFDDGNDIKEPQPGDKISLWHQFNPSKIDEKLSEKLGVAMFSQTDLRLAAEAGVQIIGMSLGALEKEFITIDRLVPRVLNTVFNKLAHNIIDTQNEFCNLVTRFGRKRLEFVRDKKCYFNDLKDELAFIKSQENQVFQLNFNNKFYTYRIVDNGKMLDDILRRNELPDTGLTKDQPITLCMVLSIEGLHNLDAINEANEATVLKNAHTLKSEFPLFFVTFSHHFWNGLCGHSQSLSNFMAGIFNQDDGIGEGFNELGIKVLMALLDQKSGRRIPIDIKHLSYKARRQYFTLLGGNVPDNLAITPTLAGELKEVIKFSTKPDSPFAAPPIIVSHAAVNGRFSPTNPEYHGNFPAQQPPNVVNPFDNPNIADPAINLYDEDLLTLGNFSCLIGIQLDERRIAGTKGVEVSKTQGEDAMRCAYLVWNQIIHIIELWDQNEDIKDAWDRICIGSDFDGLVNPLKGLERFDDYAALRDGLLRYCELYFMPTQEFEKEFPDMGQHGVIANRFQFSARNQPVKQRLNPIGNNVPAKTGLSPKDIVDKICVGNARVFIKKHFV